MSVNGIVVIIVQHKITNTSVTFNDKVNGESELINVNNVRNATNKMKQFA